MLEAKSVGSNLHRFTILKYALLSCGIHVHLTSQNHKTMILVSLLQLTMWVVLPFIQYELFV